MFGYAERLAGSFEFKNDDGGRIFDAKGESLQNAKAEISAGVLLDESDNGIEARDKVNCISAERNEHPEEGRSGRNREGWRGWRRRGVWRKGGGAEESRGCQRIDSAGGKG